MSSINRQPTGWLGFLGIKNFGRNPVSATEQLLPTWNLQELYLNAAAEYGNIPFTAVGGLGDNVVFQAGSDAIYIDTFSAYLQTGAGQAIQAALTRVKQDSTYAILLEDPVSIGASTQTATALKRPIWLQPGEQLGVNVLALTGAPNWAIRWRFTRLRA